MSQATCLRGLKSLSNRKCAELNSVASYMLAWIEIERVSYSAITVTVASYILAWIEIDENKRKQLITVVASYTLA